jgi:hypothetical protein
MSPEDFEKLVARTEVKLSFDETNLMKKITEVPSLHTTYLRILKKEKEELADVDRRRKRCYATKYEYYKFNHSFRYDTKNEVETQIEGDQAYQVIDEEYQNQLLVVEYLEGVMKLIHSLSFHHKNYIAEQNYLAGN